MATKHTDECLRKAGPDEPLFVLRARDSLAPQTVLAWCALAEEAGVNPAKVKEARALATLMQAWQVGHERKLPD